MDHDKHKWRAGNIETEEMTFTGPYVKVHARGALLIFDGLVAIVGGSTPEKALANACLIAAAPELLEACNEARHLYDELALGSLEAAAKYGPDYTPPTDEEWLEMRQQLEAAIAKATE